ncbi:hypothetical protein GCM10023257_70720 [Streptomyces hyderabadensis]|uniref:Uncharacterized protein n=1 Tax=Streptomyces hyderabadensis TaxID=598549 RepID=A0ABP9IWU8_9ACTN
MTVSSVTAGRAGLMVPWSFLGKIPYGGAAEGPEAMGPPHGWEPRARTRRARDRRAHRTRRR